MRHTARYVGTAALTAGIMVVAVGCQSGGGDVDGDGTVTLNITTHTNMGFEALLPAFEEEHPNIKVELSQLGMADLATSLTTQLAAGSGAPDVVGVGDSWISALSRYQDRFLDLRDFDGEDVTGDWLPWVAEAATLDDGFVMGYRTDTGGLAMCYNKDLFEAAGLPTDREEVSALWPTWEDYIETGRTFAEAGLDASWTDSGQNIFQAALYQVDQPLMDADNELDLAGDPGNELAYQTATTLAEDGLTAGTPPFSDELKAALAQGKIATSMCPPWYSGLLQNWIGEAGAGTWDIATVPEGKGNWGGSYLLVPEQTAHPDEARLLARWLTEATQQEQIFVNQNTFPSATAAVDSDAVQSATSDYFSDAPIGKIYSDALRSTTGQRFGANFEQVQAPFIGAVNRVEQGLQDPSAAWDQAVSEAESFIAGN